MTRGITQDRSRWIVHLEALIDQLLEQVPFGADAPTRIRFVDEFRDEFGNRRASDRAFLSQILGVEIEPTREAEEMGLDERLWWCVARNEKLPEGLISTSGGLLIDPDSMAIEYRTMVELGALQALWAIAMRDGDRTTRVRALDAARWNIEELQPDNAINRPWGLPVFIELAACETDETTAQTSDLHAQTLLHNACINFGKPDFLSALILKNAVDLLRLSDQ